MKKRFHAMIAPALVLTFVMGISACEPVAPPDSGPAGETVDAAAPVITVQPSDLTLRKGEETQGLEVVAYSTDNGTLSYQWYKGTSSDDTNGTAVENATGSTFPISTSENSLTFYYCVVTNTNAAATGKKTATSTSSVAQVKIFSSAETPRITAEPSSANYVFGGQNNAVALKVEAAVSSGTLSYQWYSNDEGSYDNATRIDEATDAQYTPDIRVRGIRYYYCEITNTDPTASESKTAVARSKIVAIGVDYDFSGFTFEAIDDETCKLTAYTGGSLSPYIPDTDRDGRKVVAIANGVFFNNTSIVEVTIPDTVEELGSIFGGADVSDGVFRGCSSLRFIHFNGKFKKVGGMCFSMCSSIESDVWSMCSEMTTLGDGSFQNMPLPTDLEIPATLTGSIGYWCFESASGVHHITFAGQGVTEVATSAFGKIATLESIVFPASVSSYGSGYNDPLKDDEGLRSVTIERSLVTDGPISGIPFDDATEFSPEMKIYVPEDSYLQYCELFGRLANRIVPPEAEGSYTLTIEGATIDGQSEMELEPNGKLDPDASVSFTGGVSYGWIVNGTYYVTYQSLAEDFRMGYADTTLRAVYEEDFTIPFTPYCNVEPDLLAGGVPNSGLEAFTMEHVDVEGGKFRGTRYVSDHKMGRMKLREDIETHPYKECPIIAGKTTVILMTFTNNGTSTVTFKYRSEYFGEQGAVNVTLTPSETKTMLLVQNANATYDTPNHEILFSSGDDNGFDLTIYGRRVDPTAPPREDGPLTLTIEGATINGQSSMTLETGDRLDAGADVVYTGGTNYGWLYNEKYYTDYAALVEVFRMGAYSTTVRALYEEDFTIPFTPFCNVEPDLLADGASNSNNATVTMQHVDIEGGKFKGTRYISDHKMGRMKLRSDIEEHGNSECPIIAGETTVILMTFTNNGENDVTFKYQSEYFGVQGELTVTLTQGETKTMLLVQNATATAETLFHQIIFESGDENGFDVTIYGRRVDPTAPPREDGPLTLTIEGATIDGQSSMTLETGATLDAGADVVYTGGTNYGWLYNEKYYKDYAALAAAFRMGTASTTVKAVYEEDFIIPFTPYCNVEPDLLADGTPNSNYETVTMQHVDIEGGKFLGTRYVSDHKMGRMKLRDDIETHPNKECPIVTGETTVILMTFTNNGKNDVTFKYQSEYFGVQGEVTVTLAQGETKTMLLVQDATQTAETLFHQIIFESGDDNGFDVTIYGRRVI